MSGLPGDKDDNLLPMHLKGRRFDSTGGRRASGLNEAKASPLIPLSSRLGISVAARHRTTPTIRDGL